jgi:alkylation response protein AidB-like acyl-CoA dehydrogenase
VDLEFTEEQDLLRETVRGLCARHCGLDVVRQLEDDAVGYPEKLWVQLAELGLLDDELSMLDRAIVFQELGRALAPSPAFASAVVSAGALRRAGADAWANRASAGEAIVVPA